MLLSEIASFMNIGLENQIKPEQALLVMDAVQKAAFSRNTDAFLVYDRKVEIVTELVLGSLVSAPTDADVGSTVTGAISGATGVLSSVSDDGLSWRIKTGDTFAAGETITVGTASGTLSTDDYQQVWRGPYAAPSDCRKIWGITSRLPGRFDSRPRGIRDYGEPCVTPRPFKGGDTNDLDNTFLFSVAPALTDTLYWVFWRNAPDITSFKDQSRLKIPAAYHTQFIACCVAAAQMILTQGRFDDALIDHYLGGWLASLSAPYRDQDDHQNMTLAVGDGLL